MASYSDFIVTPRIEEGGERLAVSIRSKDGTSRGYAKLRLCRSYEAQPGDSSRTVEAEWVELYDNIGCKELMLRLLLCRSLDMIQWVIHGTDVSTLTVKTGRASFVRWLERCEHFVEVISPEAPPVDPLYADMAEGVFVADSAGIRALRARYCQLIDEFEVLAVS